MTFLRAASRPTSRAILNVCVICTCSGEGRGRLSRSGRDREEDGTYCFRPIPLNLPGEVEHVVVGILPLWWLKTRRDRRCNPIRPCTQHVRHADSWYALATVRFAWRYSTSGCLRTTGKTEPRYLAQRSGPFEHDGPHGSEIEPYVVAGATEYLSTIRRCWTAEQRLGSAQLGRMGEHAPRRAVRCRLRGRGGLRGCASRCSGRLEGDNGGCASTISRRERDRCAARKRTKDDCVGLLRHRKRGCAGRASAGGSGGRRRTGRSRAIWEKHDDV